MRTFGLILYFIFLTVIITFAVFFAKYNAYFVNIGFLGMYIPPAPLWVIVFISFALGFVASALMFSWKLIRLSISRKKYMKSYENIKSLLEQKIKDLKIGDEE
ncbi:MAG: LapA family protein [bacterium]